MQNSSHHLESPIAADQKQKKTRRTASEWAQIISDYQTSGLTQRDYCEQHDVPYSSFTNWFAKLKKNKPVLSTEPTHPPLFVDVTAQTPLAMATQSDWDVELAFLNGTILRLKQR